MKEKSSIFFLLAITAVIASFVVSCSGRLAEAGKLNLEETPLQTVDDMFAVRTQNGKVNMRMEAKVMEHYEKDTCSIDYFPKGLAVYGYTEEGLLETIIVSDAASHHVSRKREGTETWSAYGNVIIQNIIKQETMETDTLYWDQSTSEIFTDSYIKMYSPKGFMQGYGMRSDDHAKNAILHRPFNGYGRVVEDTTAVLIDSVNFIGPFPKK
ncbi:MAG: LPS export ABC transporter periplasmic protein LptC [Bacteroidales bacterium]|nr:LPS export ABC transporter periplasmic protein LptC [Bacteroidales bacterium]